MTEDKFMAKNHCLKEFTEHTSLWSSIRNFTFEKFGVWDVWDILPYRWNMWYHDVVTPIFKPKNSRLRKAIPRQWRDISGLIVDVNFEFIKAFYEDEYVDGVVDWTATEHHQEFANWLEHSYQYITKERPSLENEKDEAYPKSNVDFLDSFIKSTNEKGETVYQLKDDGIPYDIKYKEVNRLEKLIEDKDSDVLMQLIKRRDYFWT